VTADKPLGTLIVIWGVPGTGKSAFARWLAEHHGYTFIDTDAIVVGRMQPTTLSRRWEQTYKRLASPSAFMDVVATHGHPVVAEYGRWATDENIALLANLRELGADPWWFDGYPLAAYAAWRKETPNAGRVLDDGAWHRVVDVINANRRALEQFFGRDRMLRTIEKGSGHEPPEAIYARMQQVLGGSQD